MKHEMQIKILWHVLTLSKPGFLWKFECEVSDETEAEEIAQYIRDTTTNAAVKVVEVWV
jgi:hypothetical protein